MNFSITKHYLNLGGLPRRAFRLFLVYAALIGAALFGSS